jgi:hypothetical protein
MKPFIYLIQAASGIPYPEIPDPACDQIVLNWQAPDPRGDALYLPGSSWNEGRNRLLWEALERARTTGNDYLYYIFMDDDCVVREDTALARELHVPLTGNPFRTFERFLLEWEPAVGYTRYDWQHYEKGRAVNLGHNIDGLFNAFHRETLTFLLPYYTGFDNESWLYSQHIINHMASLLYHPYRIQCNLVTTTNTRRQGYAQRKKYWHIPTTFLAGALKTELRQTLNTAAPNSPTPAPGSPRKKDRSYRITPALIARDWRTDHPLIMHRQLNSIRPRPAFKVGTFPRVAVCLSGRCCGLDRTYRSIRQNLLAPLGHCDLFMYVPDDEDARFASLLRPTVLRVVPDRPLDEGGLQNGRDCLLKVGIQGYLQQLYGLKMCDRLRQTYEKKHGIRYDLVLRCRPDLLFDSPLPAPESLDLNYIHVPDFHMYEGCNDRLAIGNPENMTMYMNKFDDWQAYVRAWVSASPAAPPVTAEMFTAGHLRQHGIGVKLLPIRFNRVRTHKIKPDWEDHQRKQKHRRARNSPGENRAPKRG